MKTVIGIDQGNQHTWAVVCDLQGNLLGLGTGEGACHTFDGMEKAMNAITQAVQQALEGSVTTAADLLFLYGGLTGADWQDDFTLLTDNLLKQDFCTQVQVANDSMIALRGGTEHPYGAIIIAGSGGNCAVRAPDGREFIYGFFHDFNLQGAWGLGRIIMDAVYRSHTGREPHTLLTEKVLAFYEVNNVDDMMRMDIANQFFNMRSLQLPPLLFEAAYEGDELAARIIYDFGKGNAGLVTHAIKKLDMTNLEFDVIVSGGIFKGKGSLLMDVLNTYIHMVAPRARLVNARYEPVVGAALLALEKAGVALDEQVKHNIEESAKKLNLVRVKSESFVEVS
jgi:N-acetylglucosamine kinase-like BadF-type ATPase